MLTIQIKKSVAKSWYHIQSVKHFDSVISRKLCEFIIACWVLLHVFVVCPICFKLYFRKSCKDRHYTRVSNRFDPDVARRFVGPHRGPNCLQGLSADDKRRY